jgi:hypothetical protein
MPTSYADYSLLYATAGAAAVKTPMAKTDGGTAGAMTLVSSSSSSSFPGFSQDPSRGGRGAAMGQKKAKQEYEKQIAEDQKEKRFKKIEESICAQTAQLRLVKFMSCVSCQNLR